MLPENDGRLMADRLPPHNVEVERYLLAALVSDPGSIPAVRAILRGPGDFYRATHAGVYRAICGLADRGAPITGPGLWDELLRLGVLEQTREGQALYCEILAVDDVRGATYHAEIVRRKAIGRDLIDVAGSIRLDAYRQGETVETLLRRAMDRLNTLNTLITPGTLENQEEIDARPVGPDPWVPDPETAVYQGVAAEIVDAIKDHTEAHPLALLGSLLVLFGNVVGRGPHVVVEATRHGCNEFVLLVGGTALGRKGTATDWIKRLFRDIDETWADGIRGGLSSGEGLIATAADPDDPTDPRPDKRVMILETEFSSVLRALEREGNKLSELVRQLWDHGNLSTLTKKPLHAAGIHGSILGHITPNELRRRLDMIEMQNGFANRFFPLAARRVRELPFGGEVPPEDLATATATLRGSVLKARDLGEIGLTPAARALWLDVYHELVTPPDGTLGELLSRGAPHVRRVAMLYSLLDQEAVTDRIHMEAALALWHASRACVEFLFAGEILGPRERRILDALAARPDGMTRTELNRQVFSSHKIDLLDAALRTLLKSGKITETPMATPGRPKHVYQLKNDLNP